MRDVKIVNNNKVLLPKSARNRIFIWNTNARKLHVTMLIIARLYADKPKKN